MAKIINKNFLNCSDVDTVIASSTAGKEIDVIVSKLRNHIAEVKDEQLRQQLFDLVDQI